MSFSSWFELLTAAFGGGVVVKFLDILYQEFKQRSERSRTAKQIVDDNLDPLLKAADELVGKLRSLAESDFRLLHSVEDKEEIVSLESSDLGGLMYLFARFWARIEILRLESLAVALSEDPRGKKLLNYLDCMESRRVRIIDRTAQRAIGETLILDSGNLPRTISYIRFVKSFESDDETRRWFNPLIRVITRTRHTSHRQRLLQYGVVVHSLIDTLDPDNLVTRERPSYPNKLTKRSWRDLKYRVFGQYLPFALNKEKYLEGSKVKRAR